MDRRIDGLDPILPCLAACGGRRLAARRKDFRDRPLAGAGRPGVAMGQEVRVAAPAQPQPGERLKDRHGSTTHST
jgi:hypothetical protein